MVPQTSIKDVSNSKWVVMVCLDGKDDWIYVTEDSKGNCWDLQPMMFDNLTEALDCAKIFTVKGREQNVKVVNI